MGDRRTDFCNDLDEVVEEDALWHNDVHKLMARSGVMNVLPVVCSDTKTNVCHTF